MCDSAAIATATPLVDLGEPGHVALAGDWHGNLQWARRMVKAAVKRGLTTVVQVGDFGVWPRGEFYLDGLEALCAEYDIVCAFVDGNHEDFEQLLAIPVDDDGLRRVRPHIVHLPRGTRWSWGDRTWVAVGGAVSVDRRLREEGESWWPQEELTDAEADAIVAAGPADVIVSHDCPSAVRHDFGEWPKSWDPADEVRSNAHQARLQRVVDGVGATSLFHGHLHRGYARTVEVPHGALDVVGLDADGTPRFHTVVLDLTDLSIEPLLP